MLTLLICMPLFFNDITVISSSYFRFSIFFNFINSIKWLNFLLWVIVIFCEGLYLNYLVNEFKITNQNTHFPLVLFVLLNGFSAAGLLLNQTHLIHLFLLLALHQLLLIYNERKATFKIFNAAFFLGIGTVFYLPFGVLIVLLWFVIRYVKPFYWKEYIVSILGFCVPFIYVVFYYFMTDNLTLNNLFSNAEISLKEGLEMPKIAWHYLVFIVLLTFFCIFFTFVHVQHLVVKIRKFIIIIFLLFVGILFTQLFFEPLTRSTIIGFQLITLPLSILISIPLIELKKTKIAKGIFYFLLLMLLGNYFV